MYLVVPGNHPEQKRSSSRVLTLTEGRVLASLLPTARTSAGSSSCESSDSVTTTSDRSRNPRAVRWRQTASTASVAASSPLALEFPTSAASEVVTSKMKVFPNLISGGSWGYLRVFFSTLVTVVLYNGSPILV